MSDVESESMSERDLIEHLATTVYGNQPRSVGEALAAADALEDAEPPVEPEEEGELPPEPPVVVEDEPVQPVAPTEPAPELEEPADAPTEVEEEEETEAEGDPHVVWAQKKYGDDPAKWAKAAYDQEQHISRLAGEKKEAEQLASEWYEYAQGIEAQAQQQQQMGMPLSASEEQWIENSLQNPYQYARQAALQGNFNLYQGVIARVAEENAMLAAQIGAQIQQEMMAQENGGSEYQPPTLAESMSDSIQRLGIDLSIYGEPMSAKVAELGEHHPYVQTILEGDPGARDIALMAVYDLVRSTAMSTRRVRSEERENQIKHEAELRRQAAGVVTGGTRAPEVPTQSPFMSAMEEEWKARGQWTEE